MTEEDRHKIELVAESGAQRAIISMMMEVIHILVASSASSSSTEVRQATALRLKQKKGEFLYSAPLELESDAQAVANQEFQSTFESLSIQLLKQFGSTHENV